jgi:hypothetical protein
LADPIFKAVQWKSYGLPVDSSFDYGAGHTRLDLNNDGDAELIVERTSTFRSKDFSILYIFAAGTALETLRHLKDLQRKSIGGIRIERSYDFTELPPLPRQDWMQQGKTYYEGLSFFVDIHLFVLNGKSYVLMKESPDVSRDPTKVVVGRYKKGFVESANPAYMEDVCYLR